MRWQLILFRPSPHQRTRSGLSHANLKLVSRIRLEAVSTVKTASSRFKTTRINPTTLSTQLNPLITMNQPKHHLFVCGSFRVNGEPSGICHKRESLNLLSYIQNEVQDRMLDGVEVAATGCMNMCERGPVMIDYPSENWYGNVTEEVVDAVLDAIEEGDGVAKQYLMS